MPLFKRNHINRVPMDKKSTRQLSSRDVAGSMRPAAPRRSTIEFIRQFARAYCCEPRLAPAVRGLIAN